MLPWTTRSSRYFTGSSVLAWAVFGVFCMVIPLVAQTTDVPDTPAPAPPLTPAPDTTPPPKPAIPATTPQTSAATVTSDSDLSPSEISALSGAAGPTPVSGPGASPISDLGDRLGSATYSKRLPFRVTATLGESYNNNIFAGQKKQYDYITRLSLLGELTFGNPYTMDGNLVDLLYTPTLRLYARHPHENGADQYVDLLYAHRWTKLTLSLEQLYSEMLTTNASLGGLVTTDVYKTVAKADYAYSQKLDVVAAVKQEFTTYDKVGTDNREWSGDIYGLYHVDSRLSLGIGPRIGHLKIDRSPDENFQQILARAIYIPNDKLNIQGAVGGEDRQYDTSARSDTIEPIFEFAGIYLPFPSTNLTVNASRHFTPSYTFANQDYIATNVNFTATQRFLQNYYVSLAGGYENDDYAYVRSSVTSTFREDDYYYIQPSLRWKPNGWLEVKAYDRYEEDDSNVAIFAYDSNQFGVSFSATY